MGPSEDESGHDNVPADAQGRAASIPDRLGLTLRRFRQSQLHDLTRVVAGNRLRQPRQTPRPERERISHDCETRRGRLARPSGLSIRAARRRSMKFWVFFL